MRYSTLIGKTKKDAPKDENSLNAQLLIRGGFIHKEMAGVYAFLPLGLRVLNKIVGIIREEMVELGAQELFMTALQNPEPWQNTGRWDDEAVDIWFKTKFKNGTEAGLAPTHEEPLADLMSKQISSYKDLPTYAFQFQTKFRNELRSRSGLIRLREFLMKDLYSFTRTQEELDAFYEKASDAYVKIFDRIGIGEKTVLTFASGGSFSKYSHEFQTICPAGEDTIYYSPEKKIAINREVYTDEVIADLGLKKEELQEVSAIEVGNIFKQGTKFSIPNGLNYIDADGSKKPVIMGAYGIGPGRVMGTVVELLNDERGIVWPESIAPFKVQLILLNTENAEVKARAESLYKELNDKDIEVLFDERENATAGEKFSDADLIGCPYRIVISAKTGDKIEVKKRTEKESKLMTPSEFIANC